MKNSEMPAAPVRISERHENVHTGHVTIVEPETFEGLTKREHFAGLAMQALLSNGVMGDSDLWETPQEWVKQMTETGVEMADALLKELDK